MAFGLGLPAGIHFMISNLSAWKFILFFSLAYLQMACMSFISLPSSSVKLNCVYILVSFTNDLTLECWKYAFMALIIIRDNWVLWYSTSSNNIQLGWMAPFHTSMPSQNKVCTFQSEPSWDYIFKGSRGSSGSHASIFYNKPTSQDPFIIHSKNICYWQLMTVVFAQCLVACSTHNLFLIYNF